MAAVLGGREQVEKVVGSYRGVAIAAVNGAAQRGGERGRGTRWLGVVGELAGAGVESRWLRVRRGFHSPLMEEVLEEFESTGEGSETAGAAEARDLERDGRIDWRRDGGAGILAAADAGSGRVRAGSGEAKGAGVRGRRGGGSGRSTERARARRSAGAGVWVRTLGRGRSDWERMLAAAGELYEHGVELEWAG